MTAPVPQGTASISGRVTDRRYRARREARPGHRLRRRPGRPAATTDDQGRYTIGDLSAGNYTVTASKNGFVDAIFGQKRPLQQGTPVTVADARRRTNIDLRLTRGGVITGHVVDEDGEALARALVTVQRYSYVGGERQLTPAGGEQTDDRGQYRVFGLPPGDYYVSATAGGLAARCSGADSSNWPPASAASRVDAADRAADAAAFVRAPDEPEATGYAPTYYPGVVSAPEAGKITVAPGQEVVRHRLPDPARPLRDRQRHRRGRRRHRAGDAGAAGCVGETGRSADRC